MEKSEPKKKSVFVLCLIKWFFILTFGLALLPFTIGLLIIWFIYKKILNKKLKIILIALVAVPTLLVGSAWVYAFNHPSSTPSPTPTDAPITQTAAPSPAVNPTSTPQPTVAPKTDVETIVNTPKPTIYIAPVQYVAPTKQPTTNSEGAYTCNCSKTCTQISSCAEAQYQLNVCGCKARDNDDDKIACDGAPLHCQN